MMNQEEQVEFTSCRLASMSSLPSDCLFQIQCCPLVQQVSPGHVPEIAVETQWNPSKYQEQWASGANVYHKGGFFVPTNVASFASNFPVDITPEQLCLQSLLQGHVQQPQLCIPQSLGPIPYRYVDIHISKSGQSASNSYISRRLLRTVAGNCPKNQCLFLNIAKGSPTCPLQSASFPISRLYPEKPSTPIVARRETPKP